jgi:hypothetical protein
MQLQLQACAITSDSCASTLLYMPSRNLQPFCLVPTAQQMMAQKSRHRNTHCTKTWTLLNQFQMTNRTKRDRRPSRRQATDINILLIGRSAGISVKRSGSVYVCTSLESIFSKSLRSCFVELIMNYHSGGAEYAGRRPWFSAAIPYVYEGTSNTRQAGMEGQSFDHRHIGCWWPHCQ